MPKSLRKTALAATVIASLHSPTFAYASATTTFSDGEHVWLSKRDNQYVKTRVNVHSSGAIQVKAELYNGRFWDGDTYGVTIQLLNSKGETVAAKLMSAGVNAMITGDNREYRNAAIKINPKLAKTIVSAKYTGKYYGQVNDQKWWGTAFKVVKTVAPKIFDTITGDTNKEPSWVELNRL